MTARSPTEGAPLENSPLADPDVRERLRPLTPSAKLVARILAENGPLPQGNIAEQSLLPMRTVRNALTTLEDADLVAVRPGLQDTHKQVYVLWS